MVAAFFVAAKVRFQKIGEEKYSEDYKHDKKFYQNYDPNLFTPVAKIFKTTDVKTGNFGKRIL